jgi:hypothetical protein
MPAFPSAARRALGGFFYAGFSADSLGALRLALGLLLIVFHVIQFESLLKLDPAGASFVFLDPMWHFALLGFERLDPALCYWAFALLLTSSLAMALGVGTRTAILISILCIFYLKGVRDSITGDIHHRYFLPIHMLFLLLLSRCGEVLSLGRRLRGAARYPIAEWEASWPIRAMQLYIASFYLWSAVAKLRVSGWAWLENGGRIQATLMKRSVMWGVDDGGQVLGNSLAFTLAQYPGLCTALGIAVLLMEAGFPLILLIRSARGRLAFLLAVTVFHVANFALIYVLFIAIPISFLVFFDLGASARWVRAKTARRLLPAKL